MYCFDLILCRHYLGAEHVGGLHGGVVVQKQDQVGVGAHDVAHREDEHDGDCGGDHRQRDVQCLLPAVRAVQPRRFVKRRVDGGHGGEIEDAVPPEALPDVRDRVYNREPFRVGAEGDGVAAQQRDDLVHKAVLFNKGDHHARGHYHGVLQTKVNS